MASEAQPRATKTDAGGFAFRSIISNLISWPVPALLILQILLAFFLDAPGWGRGVAFSVSVATGLLLSVQIQQWRGFLGLLLILIISAGIFQFTRHPLSNNILPQPATYQARVVNAVHDESGLCKMTVDLQERLMPLTQHVSGRIQLNVSDRCDLSAGSVVQFRGTVKPVLHYRNPGMADARVIQRRNDIWGRVHVEDAASLVVIHLAEPGFFDARRDAIRRLIRKIKPHEPDLLESFLLGTDATSERKLLQIRDAGLMHLFAISGMNFSVMAAVAYGLVSLMTRPITRLLRYFPRQKIAALLTQVFVIYYACLVAPTPSVVRAAIMIGVYLAATILERQRQLTRLILTAAAIELFFRPLDLFSLSFQLTYLCVLVLAIIGPRMEEFLKRLHLMPQGLRLITYATRLMGASLLLSVLITPLVLMEFGASPLAGIINNLWAIPLFDFALVPAALAFVGLQAFGIISLASLVLQGMDILMRMFMAGVQFSASLGIPVLSGFAPHPVHLLVFYAGAFALALWPSRRFVAGWLGVMSLSLGLTAYENFYAHDLRITQIDVGQGDAILIQSRAQNILIDTGGHRFIDIGKRVLAPVLRHYWVSRLDKVIITHPDLDHEGGLKGLLPEVRVDEIVTGPATDKKLDEALRLAQLGGTRITRIEMPSQIDFPDGVQLELLTPLPELGKNTPDNDRSVISRLSFAGFSALFTGDMSTRGEAVLITKYGTGLKSDFLKLGHHGSRSSSGEVFLAHVDPQLATVGVGENNHYGHPSVTVVQRLEEAQVVLFRTDMEGAIVSTINRKRGGGFVLETRGYVSNRRFTFFRND